MTTKSAKDEMLSAHEAMAAVLDVKLKNVPEWQAFRAIDRALVALGTEQSVAPASPAPLQRIERVRLNGAPVPYMTLVSQALTEAGKPVTTSKLMEYITRHRHFDDLDKGKIVVQSSLSKDKRFKSVPWEDGRAWWYADRQIPKKETAGG